MPTERARELMRALHQELAHTEADDELRALAQTLEEDLERLRGEGASAESLMERATRLESRFAAEHPVAEKWLRELVATLGRIGV